ncbi:MAG: lipocalin-like domain-containing protein [Acidobacteria bacterium]|nr:lipocalin-like domain-containing protein [Acidobacteriota bacterium]
MPTRSIRLLTVAGLVSALLACGGCGRTEDSDPAAAAIHPALSASERQLLGAWSLARIERRDADGEPLSPPVEDRLGYLIYDASGYMGVTLMRPDREPYTDEGPTADEALAQFGSYTSYFGRFGIDDSDGTVTHHLEGSLDPGGIGADYTRAYALAEDRLTLQPPPAPDGSTIALTWLRQPDLPASETSDTHGQLFGAYRIDSVSRHTTDGFAIDADQYETGYLFYTPSGHMSVHLMRPGRAPFAGESPTAEEALRLSETYVSYFGPYEVNEMAGCITCPGPRDQGYLIHRPVGSADPRGRGTEARRYYELSDTHLTLRPPVRTDDEGREVVTALRWTRLPTH